MTQSTEITTLFLDIGGVLLTNGWDRNARARAATEFQIDLDELNQRHHLTFDMHEIGKLSLDEYLQRAVFHEPRDFSKEQFREFMFAQSKFLPDMLELMCEIKETYDVTVAAVSNEGRELTEFRIDHFNLHRLFDVFVCSCFVHFRKPDIAIYRLALDLTQAAPDEVAYVDDRAMFVDVADRLGIRGICHRSVEDTKEQFAALGMPV
jgi:putative hydrolase of the HAD superfamily